MFCNAAQTVVEYIKQLFSGEGGAFLSLIHISSVTTTGYGEELVKNAFRCDFGLVETVAHFTAAKYFMPDVDFIIDIGGQDMKCFKIEDGAILSLIHISMPFH